MLARGVDRQASPAAADVEHALAGLQLELAADQLELGALGLLQGLRPRLEQRAAVGHRLVQEQREELVRDVVVVANGLARRAACVCRPRLRGRSSAAGGRGRRRSPAARSAAAPSRSRCGEAERRRVPAAEQGDDPVQVVDLDLPAHVGAAEPQLARRAQNVADGPRRADGQGRAAAGRRHTGPVPELDREGAVVKRSLDAATQSVGG